VSESRRVAAEVSSPVFPVAVAGYDRRAVDAYVARVNRVIGELEAGRSPERAVDRALGRAEAKRSQVLEEALETAVEITEAARREADEMRAEAVAMVVNASGEADRRKAEADGHVARARIEAERIVADARTEAAERLRRAEEEVETLRKEAETWARALRIDTNLIWGERRDLLEDLHEIAARLQQAASHPAASAGSQGGSSP
jgi:vacuolar-type H+-ATPase subunit H